jgi:hypothetical protein
MLTWAGRKVICLALFALTLATAKANLIDLTPGGFSNLAPPPIVVDWTKNHFGHDAFPMAFWRIDNPGNGWLELPPPAHEHFLQPPLVNISPIDAQTATLSWDLTGTRFGMAYVFVGGYVTDESGGIHGFTNMYQASLDQLQSGEDVITVHGTTPIISMGIYGTVPLFVPDNGTTFILFFLSLVAMVSVAKFRSTLECRG